MSQKPTFQILIRSSCSFMVGKKITKEKNLIKTLHIVYKIKKMNFHVGQAKAVSMLASN